MAGDVITAEVVSNFVLSVAEQVNETVVRCSFNPNIKERKDCSAVILDGRGLLIAQADNNPAHLGSLLFMAGEVRRKFGDDVSPGDVFIHNDPFTRGSSHLSDFTLVTPIFSREGALIFFAVNTAHHVDVGGRVPGSTAPDNRSIYEEGIRIPMVRLVHQGLLDEDLLALIAINCRDPEERAADIKGQIAANEIAREPLIALCARYGVGGVREIVDEILAYSERRARQVIRDLPDGRYEGSVYLDNDGVGSDPVPIAVAVTIAGDRMSFDFTGSGPQARGAYNCSETIVLASVYWAFKAVLDPGIPPNGGFFRTLEVFRPAGTIVNPSPTAAVGVRIDTAQKIVDAAVAALNHVVPPERRVAGSNAVNSAWLVYGEDCVRDNRPWVYIETFGGGAGARATKDGMDGVHVYMVNTQNLPVEVLEREYPIRVERYSLVPDSGGAGEFRGGLGIRRDLRLLCTPTLLTTRAEGQTRGAWGAQGGRPGQPGIILLNPGTVAEQRIPGKASNIPLSANDVVSMRTPGGGGLGEPKRRDPERIMADVADGKLTPETARRDYAGETVEPSASGKPASRRRTP